MEEKRNQDEYNTQEATSDFGILDSASNTPKEAPKAVEVEVEVSGEEAEASDYTLPVRSFYKTESNRMESLLHGEPRESGYYLKKLRTLLVISAMCLASFFVGKLNLAGMNDYADNFISENLNFEGSFFKSSMSAKESIEDQLISQTAIKDVNVRVKANAHSKVVKVLKKGSLIMVRPSESPWVEVYRKDKDGKFSTKPMGYVYGPMLKR